MVVGFVFSVAVGRMHCACRDKQGEDGGVGVGVGVHGYRKQEGGRSVRCSGQV